MFDTTLMYLVFVYVLDLSSEVSSSGDKRRWHGPPGVFQKANKYADRVTRIVEKTFPTLIPSHLIFLLSIEGCSAQAPHADGVPSKDFYQHSPIPMSALISIHKSTTLNIWPKSHLLAHHSATVHKNTKAPFDPIAREIVSIPAGHVCFFRQDLIHAGSAYASDNVRMHIMFDHPKVERNKDSVFVIDALSKSAAEKIIVK
jgi:hypothetical protein